MARQQYDLRLTRYGGYEWDATFYPAGIGHSLTRPRLDLRIERELAFYRSSEGYPTDREMLRAVRPTVATTGGKVFILSSPYGQSGALWDLHTKHFGRPSSTLVWQAAAPEMNPTLPADYLERMRQDDPDSYLAEVLGEFCAGLSTLFEPAALKAVVEAGVREREPCRRSADCRRLLLEPVVRGDGAPSVAPASRGH